MNLKKVFPYLVARYSIVVGLFFIISSLIDMPFLNAEPRKSKNCQGTFGGFKNYLM